MLASAAAQVTRHVRRFSFGSSSSSPIYRLPLPAKAPVTTLYVRPLFDGF
jgi:hypothetical protein